MAAYREIIDRYKARILNRKCSRLPMAGKRKKKTGKRP